VNAMILKSSIAAWLVALTFPIRFWTNLCLLGKRAFLQEASSARGAGGYLAPRSARQVRAQHLAHSTRLGRVARQLRKQRNLRPASSSNKTDALWNSSDREFTDGSAAMPDGPPIPPNEGWAELHDGG
jgi:hypothetical protein